MQLHSGYVYALINPAADGLVKIGKTTRDPEERAKELSSATGVPAPFIVVYSALFNDCSRAESYVHTILNDRRLSNSKEFFRVTTTEAIKAILLAEREFNSESGKDVLDENRALNDNSDLLKESNSSQDDICKNILEAAYAALHGVGQENLEDESEAIRLYLKAAKLGCKDAYHHLGELYYFRNLGEPTKNDIEQAIQYFKEGIRHSDHKCWGHLAALYSDLKSFFNADKCWGNYFTNFSKIEKGSDTGYCGYSFIKYMNSIDRRKHYGLIGKIRRRSKDKSIKDQNQEILQGIYKDWVSRNPEMKNW